MKVMFFIGLVVAVALGAFAALAVFGLIIKNQVQAQATALNPVTSLGTLASKL